jgi:hypothetical protein
MFAESQIAAGLPAHDTWRMQGHAYMTTLRSTRGLKMEEATELTRQITDGPWQQELRMSMVNALSDAVSAPTNHVQGARPQQHMAASELFYTRSDWAKFEDPNIAADPKMRTMAKRLARLGISCPSEVLLKRSIAILVVVAGGEFDQPGPAKAQALCKRLKSIIRAEAAVQNYPFAHQRHLPHQPSELLPDHFAFAYQGDDVPENRMVQGITAIADSYGYRKTHRSLRNESPVGFNMGSLNVNGIVQTITTQVSQQLASALGLGDVNIPGLRVFGSTQKMAHSAEGVSPKQLHGAASALPGSSSMPSFKQPHELALQSPGSSVAHSFQQSHDLAFPLHGSSSKAPSFEQPESAFPLHCSISTPPKQSQLAIQDTPLKEPSAAAAPSAATPIAAACAAASTHVAADKDPLAALRQRIDLITQRSKTKDTSSARAKRATKACAAVASVETDKAAPKAKAAPKVLKRPSACAGGRAEEWPTTPAEIKAYLSRAYDSTKRQKLAEGATHEEALCAARAAYGAACKRIDAKTKE